jgi:hypothetical protein
MQQKILGITLSTLGITGLIMALMGINGPLVNEHLALLMVGGSVGAVAFFSGIWLFGYQPAAAGRKSMPGMAAGKAALMRVQDESKAALARMKEGRANLLKDGQVSLLPMKESTLQ